MAISDKNRKILWARSGSSCVICKHELIIDATTSDDESVIGEECHIVSSQANGPRYDPAFPQEQIDEYSNLIILCRIHHKMVDDQKDTYPTEILRQKKIDHECWYKEKFTQSKVSSSPKVKRLKENIPPFLMRLTSGKEVLNLVDGSSALETGYDELETQEEVELISSFLSWVQDLDVLSGELALYVQTGFELTKMITELEEAGFFVFGARELRILEGGVGEPVTFPVTIFRVLRQANPEIIPASVDKSNYGN
jgi:hypothetical protein